MQDHQMHDQWQITPNRGIHPERRLGCPDYIDRIAWSPTGKYLAIGYPSKTIEIFDTDAGEVTLSLKLNDPREYLHINSLSWSYDERLIAASYQDEYVRIWRADTGRYDKTLSIHLLPVNSIAWRSSGRELLTAGTDRFLLLWDAKAGKVMRSFGGHHSAINRVAWSNSGDRIASAGADGLVLMWDTKTGQLIKKLAELQVPVNSVAWTPDDKCLVSASADPKIRIWNVESGACLDAEKEHSLWARDAVMSNCYPFMASKSNTDKKVIIWRTDTWTKISEISEPKSHCHGPAPAFHPSEPMLATLGLNDKTIAIWRLDLARLFQMRRNLFGADEDTYKERERSGDFDVFFCYNSADRPAVERIAEELRQKGLLPYVDQWFLRPGEKWKDKIRNIISKTGVAVIFIGSHGVGDGQSDEIEELLTQAAERSCRIIPVILPGCKIEACPDKLRLHYPCIDFGKIESAPLEKLVWGVTGKRTV